MSKKIIFSSLLIQMAMIAQVKAGIPQNFPADLMYLGKPIDSLCFFEIESQQNLIDLKNCGVVKNKYTPMGQNAELMQKGYIGFDWKDQSMSPAPEGYSYYKYFPADNKQFWIYTINNGGGSGDFTAISLVRRKNSDTLEMKSIAGGDRCNGGIQDVSEKNHSLTFSMNLTAFDFIDLTNDNPQHLVAYDDLSACAVCCVARAFYEMKSNSKPIFKYIDVQNTEHPSELPQQGTLQACFNKLLTSSFVKGKTTLNQQELKRFVHQFNEKCKKIK